MISGYLGISNYVHICLNYMFLKFYTKYLCITFSTIINSKCYCVSLNLYGAVIAEKTTHINLRREIKVTLVKAHKCKIVVYLHIFIIVFLLSVFIIIYFITFLNYIYFIGAAWLRLCIETEKNPLIVLDPDHIYKHDWMTVSFRNRGNYNTLNKYRIVCLFGNILMLII